MEVTPYQLKVATIALLLSMVAIFVLINEKKVK